jgi:hypothetical protein
MKIQGQVLQSYIAQPPAPDSPASVWVEAGTSLV